MPLATVVAIGSLVASAATVVSSLRNNNPKAPDPVVPSIDPKEAPTAQRTAEDKTRRRALAASAQQSTILTSPSGVASGERTIIGG